jgi:hypothetical protein
MDNSGIIKKPRGPRHQSHGPDGAEIALTILRQWPSPPCCTHGFPATVSPPRFHHRAALRPPPLPAIQGAHPRLWSLLSSSSARHRHCATIFIAIEPPHSAAPAPSELPVTTPSTASLCTTFLHRELSTTTLGRRPRRRSPLADCTSPQSSSFQ